MCPNYYLTYPAPYPILLITLSKSILVTDLLQPSCFPR